MADHFRKKACGTPDMFSAVWCCASGFLSEVVSHTCTSFCQSKFMPHFRMEPETYLYSCRPEPRAWKFCRCRLHRLGQRQPGQVSVPGLLGLPRQRDSQRAASLISGNPGSPVSPWTRKASNCIDLEERTWKMICAHKNGWKKSVSSRQRNGNGISTLLTGA